MILLKEGLGFLVVVVGKEVYSSSPPIDKCQHAATTAMAAGMLIIGGSQTSADTVSAITDSSMPVIAKFFFIMVMFFEGLRTILVNGRGTSYIIHLVDRKVKVWCRHENIVKNS